MFDGLGSPIQSKKTLRPHQERAISMLRDSLRRGNRRVVIQMPTGAGKTLTAANIIKGALAKGRRVAFTVPRINLVDQTVNAFENEGIYDIGVMQGDHPRVKPDAAVQVICNGTLASRGAPQADLIIVDEAHETCSALDGWMAASPEKFFIGLSATPWARGMGLRWQDLTIPVTIHELIEAGYLSQFTVFAPDVPDLSGVKVSKGDYVEAGLEEVMGDAQLVGNVVETWLARGEHRPTLCFAVNRAHSEQLAAAFEAAGVASAYVDFRTGNISRKMINGAFRAGEVRVICSVLTMTTGVDLPVSCIIDAAPTKSEMRHVQKIGRGLRVNPGTEDCLVLDHAGNSIRLGLVTDIRHETLRSDEKVEQARSESRREKLPKPCSKCEVLFTGSECPRCGHERKSPKIEEAKGDLVEITGKKRKHNSADKQRFWSMAINLADQRGYQRGWAARLYRDKFGVWPRNLTDVKARPDQDFLNYEKSRRIAFAKSKKRALS